MSAPCLVKPRPQNSLLVWSNSAPRIAGAGDGPPTKESLASALFPTRQGASGANPKGVWSGLPSKAGAAFSENLGSGSGAQDLDGLRKVQDEDRTGAKGTLSSIKEGEKLDVFRSGMRAADD